MANTLRYLLLGLCWLGSASALRAQADFRPGYLVPLRGDTVRGLADYRGSARNAGLCRFRLAPDAEIVAYGPAQIRGYGFVGGRQYSAQLLATIDSVQYQYGSPPQRIFMEVLAAGPLMLYYTRSKTGTDRYFVASASASAPRLLELVPQRPDDSRFVTHAYLRAPLYRSVLTEQLADCPAVRPQVAGLPFTARALTGIVQRYNACQTPEVAGARAPVVAGPALVRRAAGQRVHLGLVLGAEASHLTVSGLTFLANGHFVSSPLPVVGLGLTFPLAALSEKLSLRTEVLIDNQQYTDTFLGGQNYGNTYFQPHLNMTYLRVPLLVRYTYPTGRLRPFVQAGLCYAHRLRFDMPLREGLRNSSGTIEYSNQVKSLESEVAGIVSYEIGLAGSLGLHLPAIANRALTLEGRVENSSGFIITGGTSTSVMRYSAMLGYNFTK